MYTDILLEIGIALFIILIVWSLSHIVDALIMFGMGYLVYKIDRIFNNKRK